MSRYIDADGIDIRAREGYDLDGVLYLPYRDVRKSLDTAPSIDIVRCGECRWRKPYSDKQLECGALGLGGLKFPNDFCSYGERTISKMEQVEDEPHIAGKHADITIIDEFSPFDLSIGEWAKEGKDEPQTETQMKTQNSNLTFEKVMEEIQTQVIEFPDTHQKFTFARKIEMDGDSIKIGGWEYKGGKRR